MDANLTSILQVALQQGIWAALYIYLFYRMLKENAEREAKYQSMIDTLSGSIKEVSSKTYVYRLHPDQIENGKTDHDSMILFGIRVFDLHGFQRLAVVPAAVGSFILFTVQIMGDGDIVYLNIERGFFPVQYIQVNALNSSLITARMREPNPGLYSGFNFDLRLQIFALEVIIGNTVIFIHGERSVNVRHCNQIQLRCLFCHQIRQAVP